MDRGACYNQSQHNLALLQLPSHNTFTQSTIFKSLLASLLSKHRHSGSAAAGGLGVLALHLEAPVVAQAPAQTANHEKKACISTLQNRGVLNWAFPHKWQAIHFNFSSACSSSAHYADRDAI